MKKIVVSFYKNINGKQPVKDFLSEFDKADLKIIGEDLKTIEFSWPIGMPVCRPLSHGLYECRSTLISKRELRIIFCIIKNSMVLLNAFIKKTQKTPDREIEIARNRMKEVYNE